MAHCKITPQEFIRNSFTPQIAVICSPKVEEISRKNNLSFRELLQPFCKLGTEAHYKDPSGNVISVRNFKITLQDINFRPPQPVLARKFLNSAVSEAPDARFQTLSVSERDLQVPTSIPWFEQWRETFLQVQFPSDHEFTKHFIACMLVVATSDENPLKAMVDLTQKVNDLQSSPKLPKWFSHNILRYYVVVHEKHDPNNILAVDCFDNLKKQFGTSNVFLLRTNSRKSPQTDEVFADPWCQFVSTGVRNINYETPEASPTTTRAFPDPVVNENGSSMVYHPLSPEQERPVAIEETSEVVSKKSVVHGGRLTMEDVEQLKLLIHEFCTRSLFPFIERQVSNLHEYVTNKKGVSRSFISATKRWFTPTKPGGGTAASIPTYFPDAPELQVRRLGDLYFMFGHYAMAFQAYHSAKRDFNADQAWLMYAGALEMAALSAFMANETSRKTLDYMEESITTYLNTCKFTQFATRATLMSTECLKGRQMYGEAANQFIRMTSEESDLRSALLLEQAAYCFLLSTRPCMVRKYAFHMVLAGHRFSKAGQRKHSFRCYKQAFQVYENKGWNLAQDHIYYTIGRQASNLEYLDEAVRAYSRLLSDQSRQTEQQQTIFLKEYLTIQNLLNIKEDTFLSPPLPLPVLDTSQLKLLVSPTPPSWTPGKVSAIGITLSHKETLSETSKWNKLEEMLVQEAQGSLPMTFKPIVTLFTNSNASFANPTAIIGESIQVSVMLKNPLKILLCLKDVHLLWNFKSEEIQLSNDNNPDCEEYLKTHYMKTVTLQANATQDIVLMLTPLTVGELTLIGVCYSLVNSFASGDQVNVKGKQLFDCKPEDKRFCIKTVPSASCLQVAFGELTSDMLRNELQRIPMELRNVGSVPLRNAYVATSKPELLSYCEFAKEVVFEKVREGDSPVLREREARKNHVTKVPLPQEQLNPGQSKIYDLWVNASDGNNLDLLFYYENVDPQSVPRYRLVRHEWNFQIHESIRVEAKPHQSHKSRDLEHICLSIKIDNTNKIHSQIYSQIAISNAAMFSSRWTLLNTVINSEIVNLNPQDSARILLKAKRKVDASEEHYSEISFSEKPNSYSEAVYLDFAKRTDQSRINIFEENTPEIDERKEGTVILRWKGHVSDSTGKQRKVYGQNHVLISLKKPEEEEESGSKAPISFSDGRTDDNLIVVKVKEQEDLLSKQQQIRCNVIHPTRVVHDFKVNKLCIIRVKLLFHSTVPDSDVEVIVKTLETTNPFPLSSTQRPPFSKYSSKHCRWVRIGSAIRTLGPLSSESLDLSLAVLAPGTYDLGAHLEVWCRRAIEAETATLQNCRIQSLVIVTALA